jgi:hypothetical protein
VAEPAVAPCPSCEGYGWLEGATPSESETCEWCAGVGYVYRSASGIDSAIPRADFAAVAAAIEALEAERMRALGYTGAAKRPWEQDVRAGTAGGQDPHANKKPDQDDRAD